MLRFKDAIRAAFAAYFVIGLAACQSALPARAAAPIAATRQVELVSPDGQVKFSLTIEPKTNGALWSLKHGADEIVRPSPLGLRFEEIAAFDRGLVITSSQTRGADIAWEQPWGEDRQMREHYNEVLVTFAEAANASRTFSLRVRAFDDGLGFRYEVPQLTRSGKINVTDELTEFRINENSNAWWIEAGRFNRYEYHYKTGQARDVIRAHTPITMKTPGGTYVAFHEAALVDYPAMWLDQQRPGTFKASLVPWSDGVRAKKDGAFVTPWRTLQLSKSATGLLNSRLILNLNEPNKLGDVSWVEPGRYVGIWWCMHIRRCTWEPGQKHGATTARTKEYIDFAAEYGFSGVLVEGWNKGWETDWFANGRGFDFTEAYPDFDIEGLAAYAQSKGVRLIGHHETGGDVTTYENQMVDAFKLYERLGVRQVKTGYVADAFGLQRVDENGIERREWHDGQFSARHHLRVVQEAAKHKISINPHEPIKDTGLRRTYPNWISREGARGMEYAAWGFPELNKPEHETILPWTRLLGGPMDFTPGIVNLTFDGPTGDNRVQTTLAKQLALYLTIYSPIQMAADLPEHYRARPDALEFIRSVPVDWEKSIAIDGEIGEFVAYARQARDTSDWYVGAVTDENARTLSLKLDFLQPGQRYTAKIWRDGSAAHWKTAPYDMVSETRTLTANDTLTLNIAAGGGFALSLKPETKR